MFKKWFILATAIVAVSVLVGCNRSKGEKVDSTTVRITEADEAGGDFSLPPVIDLYQYQNEYSPSESDLRFWGWSKDGKVAFSDIDRDRGGNAEYVSVCIFNLVDNTEIYTSGVGVDYDADGNELPPTVFYDEFREVCRQNGIEFVQAEYRQLPINHNGRTYNVIYEKTDKDGIELVEYRIFAETQGKRKTVLVRTEPYIHDVFSLGYFLSPFENRALLVMGRHIVGGYVFTSFAGFDLDGGFTAITESTATATNFTRVIELKSPRMNGPDVLALQERLLSLGFSEIGTADGYYGPMTEGVIKNIQTSSHFEINGKVDRVLWDHIFNKVTQ